MKLLTVLWFDFTKGIGEGFDSDGVIHVFTAPNVLNFKGVGKITAGLQIEVAI